MRRLRVASYVFAFLTAAFALFIVLRPQAGVGHEDDAPPGKALELPERPIELMIELGIEDEQQVRWEGELKLSEGRVLSLDLVQASRDSKVDGAKFNVRTARRPGKAPANARQARRQARNRARRQAAANAQANNGGNQPKPGAKRKNAQQAEAQPDAQPAAGQANKQAPPADNKPAEQEFHLVPVRIRATLDAPTSAKAEVVTSRGSFSFTLEEVTQGEPKEFLEGQASVSGELAALRLTGEKTEDDFPVMAKAPDGTVWMAYVAYTPGAPILMDRVVQGGFEALEPRGNGDRIRLMKFDGNQWYAPIDATKDKLDLWRPTIAVDGQGVVWLMWGQPVDGNWEIFSRRYTPPEGAAAEGKWSDIVRVTEAEGNDFGAVAATDSQGRVWAAWQAFRGGNYDILLAQSNQDGSWNEPQTVSNSKANDWSPAIAADSKGNVFVAWDSYERGNYDVKLFIKGKNPQRLTIASSDRFEARPALVCDGSDRLWAAYEEGDEQWGKDYASADGYRKVGLASNPGFALYVNRTVKVKCLEDGKWKEPAGSLEEAFGDTLTRGKSVPRLAVDGKGGLWLLVRHHPLANGNGEVWHSYAMRYDGQKWSEPQHLNNSSNLMDNRPALCPLDKGLLAVYSSDRRVNTQTRNEDDLYVTLLETPDAAELRLKDAEESPATKLAAVHPNEAEDVARLRAYRLNYKGKELRPLRGEFHRHTEYSAHRDQDGLLEDTWRYAQDAGKLDWMGNGDHDNGMGHEYMWWQIQKMSDLHFHPPYFMSAMTYERSLVYPNGHRNVMMPRRGIRPLPRGDIKGTAEQGAPDTKLLYAYLKHFGGMCASHTSATSMGTDWRDNDPEVEPVVEIYQGHRHNYEHAGAPRSPTAQTQIGGFEPAGFIWNALEKGYRLGFESSSDHVSTHMSYGIVFAEEFSRPGVIAGFKQRHSYAATDNILLVVRCGEHLMGDEFETEEKPTISIEAYGTAPIARVHIVRDNKYLDLSEPKEREVHRTFTDADAQPGKTSYYYVRIEQEDGNLAWASPMWITYKP